MYKYTHFIPQNIAPKDAKSIGVYNNGKKICTIPLGRMTPPNKEKLYSFGLLADVHLWETNTSTYSNSNIKFDNALSYFENSGCSFCVISGDLTITGLYLRTSESTVGTEYLDEGQFVAYKALCDKHTIPVYELCGNHESYYGMPITNNLDLLETYTGKGELSYTVTQGNDLFILCGQNHGSSVMSDEDFQWLGETLEANKDKRCFVFVHAYIEEDSGDPLDVREHSIFESWGATKKTAFINLLNQYNNVILFHGHSHMKFKYQEYDECANYTDKNGFKSVHTPSLATPRDINFDTMESVDDRNASEGYIVDVYDDCIVLNGMDFINNKPIPLGTYKIDTIEMNTDIISSTTSYIETMNVLDLENKSVRSVENND